MSLEAAIFMPYSPSDSATSLSLSEDIWYGFPSSPGPFVFTMILGSKLPKSGIIMVLSVFDYVDFCE